MADAGADIIVAHLGLTTKGSIGASTAVTLEDAPGKVQEIADAAKKVNKDVIVLCHRGPISEPADAEYVLHRRKECTDFTGHRVWKGYRWKKHYGNDAGLQRDQVAKAVGG